MTTETFTVGPHITIARRNDRGQMQCVECDVTFGPATDFASRFEAEDQWMDVEVYKRCEVAKAHYLTEHDKSTRH